MQKIDFIKMHGLGNDFVIIDKRSKDIAITENLIRKLSDRRTGAGCDQLITINNSKKNADADIEIFNPEGDRAEACGNGTRCVAKVLFNENEQKELLRIHSDAGILEAKKEGRDNISVNMGILKTEWYNIPLSKEMDTMNIPILINGYSKGVAVNVGNPHIVFFGNSIHKANLKEIGPSIENHEFFPSKTNVELVEIINPHTILMRVWERGAGSTLACGSGACAAVYACLKKKLTENKVEVKLEKGSLFINIVNDEAIMIGPAETSYHGSLEI